MSSLIDLQEWLQQNPNNHERDERLFLTEEEVRAFLQFQDVKLEEVENIIHTLHDLALVTYELFCKESHQNEIIRKVA